MSLRPGGGGRRGRGDGRTGKYKKGMDMVEARRRREEGFVEIRKSKRGDSLSRKRREVVSSDADLVHILGGESIHSGPPVCRRHGVGASPQLEHDELEKIPEMAQLLWSEDPAKQIKASTYFRTVTSIEENPPIDLVIKAGIMPRLVQFLPRKDLPAQQFEAAWTLTNVASGTSEQTQLIIDHHAIPIFVELLSSPKEEVREQAVCALGNVAGDSSSGRDIVLAGGALNPLLALLNPQSRLSMLRKATWALSNLFRGSPPPDFDQIKPALAVLQKLVYSNDDDILKNACWALAYLFYENNDKMKDIFSGTNIFSRLVDLLTHPSHSVQTVSLKVVGTIAAGDDSQAQIMACCLVCFKSWCIMIVNTRVASVDWHAGLSPTSLRLKQAEFDVKREAAWAILNATSRGTFEQIHFIANQGCIWPLCNLLVSPDAEVVLVCLEALENMLKVGEAEKELGSKDGAVNMYTQEVDDCDGLPKIENLQLHPHPSISHAAIRMLERYWEEEDDDADDDNDDKKEDKGEEGEGDGHADNTSEVPDVAR